MIELKNRAFIVTLFTVMITVTLQFVFIRFASYEISRIDYGNFVLLQTLIAALSSIFLQIPGQSFDRFYNQTDNKNIYINEFRTILIGINIASLFIIGIYGLIMDKFSIEVLFILFIYFILLNNFALNQKVFLLNMERGKYFYLKILEASSKFLFPIVGYLYFQTLESLFIATSVGYLFSYIVLINFLKDHHFTFVIKWNNIKKYFLFAYPIIFVSIFTWGISFSDRYFIEYYLTTEDVGIYSLLAVVAGVGQIVGQVYFMYAEPKVLKNYEKNQRQTFEMINRYLKKLVVVFIIISIVAIILPRDIYTILLEKEIVYNEYYFLTMMILLVSIFVNILHIAHHMYLKLIKRLDILAYILFISLIINLIGNLFISHYGIIAAAISTLLAYMCILLLQIFYINRYFKVKQKSGNN